MLVRSEADGAIAIGAAGTNFLDQGRVEGEDPLAPFGPNAAKHVKRSDGFPHCGDLMINSTYWTETDEVAAFEELVGSHGGMGGEQAFPFALVPSDLRAPGRADRRPGGDAPPAAPLAGRPRTGGLSARMSGLPRHLRRPRDGPDRSRRRPDPHRPGAALSRLPPAADRPARLGGVARAGRRDPALARPLGSPRPALASHVRPVGARRSRRAASGALVRKLRFADGDRGRRGGEDHDRRPSRSPPRPPSTTAGAGRSVCARPRSGSSSRARSAPTSPATPICSTTWRRSAATLDLALIPVAGWGKKLGPGPPRRRAGGRGGEPAAAARGRPDPLGHVPARLRARRSGSSRDRVPRPGREARARRSRSASSPRARRSTLR